MMRRLNQSPRRLGQQALEPWRSLSTRDWVYVMLLSVAYSVFAAVVLWTLLV